MKQTDYGTAIKNHIRMRPDFRFGWFGSQSYLENGENKVKIKSLR